MPNSHDQDQRGELKSSEDRVGLLRREPRDWRVRVMAQWVEQESGALGLTLTHCAKRLRCSAHYLGRLFELHTGVPFRAYMRAVRMQSAARSMADPAKTLHEIAASLGYADACNFTRDFRAEFGETPRAYRQKLLAGIGQLNSSNIDNLNPF